jgi:hypothetical protein
VGMDDLTDVLIETVTDLVDDGFELSIYMLDCQDRFDKSLIFLIFFT